MCNSLHSSIKQCCCTASRTNSSFALASWLGLVWPGLPYVLEEKTSAVSTVKEAAGGIILNPQHRHTSQRHTFWDKPKRSTAAKPGRDGTASQKTRKAAMRETHAAANATASSSCLPADPAPDALPPRLTLAGSTGLAICPTSSCDRSPPAFGVAQRLCEARVEWDIHTYIYGCQAYAYNSIRFRRTSKFVHTGLPKEKRRSMPYDIPVPGKGHALWGR